MKITEQLDANFSVKYGGLVPEGWSPRLSRRFGYFNPDDIQETVVSKLVTAETTWLDVGCGRDIFSSNRPERPSDPICALPPCA